MTPSAQSAAGASEPLDARDVELLGAVRTAYDGADPVPGDLVERVAFALALENIDIEVLHLREEIGLSAAGARGEEQSRTVTFDSDSLTIMIQLSPSGAESIRIDGWLAPPAAHRIEVRTTVGPIAVMADEDGRFVVEPVPKGMAQLIVRTDGVGAGPGRTVVTPSIVV